MDTPRTVPQRKTAANGPVNERAAARLDGVVLTANEAAELLKIGRKTMVRLFIKGEIPARRIGSQWRVLRASLDNYMIVR